MIAAHPIAFLLALAAVPLVLAYMHRRKRGTLAVSSAILLRCIAGETTARHRAFARPRHLLSLLLMLIAMLALVHALADIRDGEEPPRDFVFVLDTSTSMDVLEPDGRTRLEHAIERMSKTLDALAHDDRAALVTTGAQTVVRMGYTEDRGRLIDVAREQRPSWCGGTSGESGCVGQAEAALRIADAMCRKGREGSIVFVSDGVGVSIPNTQCPILHLPVGKIGSNVGITALSVREADALGLTEVYLQLTAAAHREQALEVELRVDDTIVDIIAFDVPPEGQVERLHRLELPEGQIVSAHLRRPGRDALAADDTAETPRRAGLRVETLLVADTPRSFVAEALNLHPRVDLTRIGPHDRIPEGSKPDLIVLETAYKAGALPHAPHVAALGTQPELVGLRERGRFAAPEIVRWSSDDPLLRFVNLDDIALARATTVELDDGQSSLIDTDEGALAVLTLWEGRKALYLGFSPAESDLVLRVGFVNFVANLVEWAAPSVSGDGQATPGLGRAALPAIESRIAPPDRLEGTTPIEPGSRAGRGSLWRIFVLVALSSVALEWLLPALGIRRTLAHSRRAASPSTTGGIS